MPGALALRTKQRARSRQASDGGLLTSPTRPYKLNSTLPPGRWKIEFSTDDGLKGEVEFTVENTSDEVRPRINLK